MDPTDVGNVVRKVCGDADECDEDEIVWNTNGVPCLTAHEYCVMIEILRMKGIHYDYIDSS